MAAMLLTRFKFPSVSRAIYPRLLRKLREITDVATRAPGEYGTKIDSLAQMCTLHHEPMDKGLFLITDLRSLPSILDFFVVAPLRGKSFATILSFSLPALFPSDEVGKVSKFKRPSVDLHNR